MLYVYHAEWLSRRVVQIRSGKLMTPSPPLLCKAASVVGASVSAKPLAQTALYIPEGITQMYPVAFAVALGTVGWLMHRSLLLVLARRLQDGGLRCVRCP